MLKWIQEWFEGHGLGHDFMGRGESGLPVWKYPRFRVRPFLAWYDLWMGVYIDRKDRQVYVCYLPCCVLQIGYQWKR